MSGFSAKSSDMTVNTEGLRGIPEEPQILGRDILYFVWKAVLARNLAQAVGEEQFAPGSWLEAAQWIGSHAEESSRFFGRCDHALSGRETKFFLVCDMLSLAKEDERFQHRVLRALLQNALNTRGYRSIRIKAVLTPEMLQGNVSPLNFVDASKLLPTRSELWQKNYREDGLRLVRRHD